MKEHLFLVFIESISKYLKAHILHNATLILESKSYS